MNNVDFIKAVNSLRRNREITFDEFEKFLRENTQFEIIVSAVESISNSWGESVGLIGAKKTTTTSVSDQEKIWEAYFKNHSFDSISEKRNLVDAMSIVTGIDLLRFVTLIKPNRKEIFPAYLAIVPTGNSNSHNYKIGEPILSFGNGYQFHKLTGSYGNDMSANVNDYRIATRSEIERLITSLMLKMDSVVDNLVFNLITQ